MSDVNLKGCASNENVEAQVEATHQALRVTSRPMDHIGVGLVGGYYLTFASFSNTAAKPAGGSDIFSMRWTDSRFFFVLKRLVLWSVTTTAYTATLNQDFAAFIARSFQVAPSAGTQILPAAGGQVARYGMRKTGLDGSGGVLWASSGDLLTIGTRTLETQPFGYCAFQNPITTPNVPAMGVLYEERETAVHPIILTANEGFVVQTPIGNAQAAGVTKYTLGIIHAEIPAF